MDVNKQQAIPTEALRAGHETRDVNLRLIITSLTGLFILIVVSLLLIWAMFNFLETERQAAINVPLPPLAGDQQPPEPRLQSSPQEDLQITRAKEEAILNNFGWVNEDAGVIRIPIDRAIELMLERGLPVQPERGD